ncbi:MAG: C4-dicarboxylate ABC transporter substrate-binding protein [Bradyrhizobium sp.]|uniref:TAXI family TRAP transporter solute-binding subunit n=1 Tax=Bradyrhizobium sp. TaxID=376 RepID=UPI001227A95F|nr:TAXI family TRAP transporter solute-binding subunit [Bradyrhizobium sp.]THD61934.1 MAG: C4-dicarboxylate ABC transporter substrate-binding protein [Bradyrhizobium sp.]
MASIKLPLWLRAILVVVVLILAAAAGLFGYRYYTHPVTLTVAVGSIDGEAAKAMSAIASHLVSIDAPVRFQVVDTGTALGAAQAFAAGKVKLAVVRGDVGDLSQGGSVVIVARVVALLVAPPGSTIDGVAALKGHTVGVIGEETNTKLIDALSTQYGLVRAKTFKDVTLADARRALQTKEISALLVVIPLSEKYLALVRGLFQQNPKLSPVLIPIDSAGAIAEAERAYESFDVPKGTLRGNPPVPDDDLTTLRTSLYLVANKKLSTDLVTTLTQTIMKVRRELLVEQPIFAQITAPSTDPDAYLPLHPGAAAFYNGTQQSFMDEYGNWIYLAPMILGALATALATAWKFLRIGQSESEAPLDALYALGRRIRKAGTQAELDAIEEEIDGILKTQRARAADGDESAVDATTLNVVAHRLENLVHDRRAALEKGPVIASAA